MLPSEQVHVCAWHIDRTPAASDWKLLNEEETLRAQRFVFPRDRDRYVCAHSTLRRLLGSYCQIAPERIFFSTTDYGKPAIQPTGDGEPLQFNLSHSGGLAVLAVSRQYPLGVDIERIRDIDPDVAEHHFSSRELQTLKSLPAEIRLAGFYRCWTSKEALLKGEGLGLNLPLDSFDVEAHPMRAPALLASRSQSNLQEAWALFALQPTHDTLGAVAVRNAGADLTADAIQCFSLNE
ncbi:MAG TPA: 4'-phosphopantetheinyl transferase superfamily protein [Acidobacteriaceae bacterium]|nr:4'-phosphopantetheinyl transferase superfamily protein [Acidobacteriaceae bacterium]